jgi:hypothetical protein
MTPVEVFNQALQFIGAQTQITVFGDGSSAFPPAANAADVLYMPTVQLVLRQNDPDFARYTVALAASAAAPPPSWAFAYTYPADCLRVRQLRPPTGSYNVFDPQPVRGNVAFVRLPPGNTPGKAILTNQPNALAVYTTSLATEDQWDSIFEQAVVRQLANPLALALAGRPDYARELLEEAGRYEQLAEFGDESMARSV